LIFCSNDTIISEEPGRCTGR